MEIWRFARNMMQSPHTVNIRILWEGAGLRYRLPGMFVVCDKEISLWLDEHVQRRAVWAAYRRFHDDHVICQFYFAHEIDFLMFVLAFGERIC